MQKIKNHFKTMLSVLSILVTILVPTMVSAQTTSEAVINNFKSEIVVNRDNSVDVVDVIDYETGVQEKHGIYLNISEYSSQGRPMELSDVSVSVTKDGYDKNQTDLMANYAISNKGRNREIKIGSAGFTFSGKATYTIRYHLTKAVAQLKDVAEIYWDVTGTNWTIPIINVDASVILPDGTFMKRSSCYYGPSGSKTKCSKAKEVDGRYVFNYDSTLASGNGVTIALGFSKNGMVPYAFAEDLAVLARMYWYVVLSVLLPFIVFLIMFCRWFRSGRDKKGSGVIVPQYDVVDNLTPLQVGAIMNEKVCLDYISAEIIYLAVQGYISISKVENAINGGYDYNLRLLKENYSKLNSASDLPIIDGLFRNRPRSILMSSVGPTFLTESVPMVIDTTLNSLKEGGYYSSLGNMARRYQGNSRSSIAATVVIGFVLLLFVMPFVFMTLIFLVIFSDLIMPTSIIGLVVPVSLLVTFVIYKLFMKISPAKTKKGADTKEKLLGLKEYLSIAEKDRINFHNAPEKSPKTFEKFLPYAMVMGVTKIWMREFSSVYDNYPEWYSDSSGGTFVINNFVNDLSNFSDSALFTPTFSSDGSSNISGDSGGDFFDGGSDGGGDSGGGGGGGGGGDW